MGLSIESVLLTGLFACRERQNREESRRVENAQRDLTRAPEGVIPPPYSAVDSELSGGETTETSLSEPEPTDTEDEPISPPPPYAP